MLSLIKLFKIVRKLIKIWNLSVNNYQKMILGRDLVSISLIGLALYFMVDSIIIYLIVFFLVLYFFSLQDFHKIFVFELGMVIPNGELIVYDQEFFLLFKKSGVLFGGVEDYSKRINLRSEVRKYHPKTKYKVKNLNTDDSSSDIYTHVGYHPTLAHIYHYDNRYCLFLNNFTSKPRNAILLIKKGQLSSIKDTYWFKDSGVIVINNKSKLIKLIQQVEDSKVNVELTDGINKNPQLIRGINDHIEQQAIKYCNGHLPYFVDKDKPLIMVLNKLTDKIQD